MVYDLSGGGADEHLTARMFFLRFCAFAHSQWHTLNFISAALIIKCVNQVCKRKVIETQWLKRAIEKSLVRLRTDIDLWLVG